MKSVFLFVAALLAVNVAASRVVDEDAPKPHILFVIVDDFGWANAGWHRDVPTKEVVTPTMNQLVAEGIELNRHYVHMMCTPTRSSFISGRLPVHVQLSLGGPCTLTAGVTRNMTGIAQHLKAAGYMAHQVGKWDAGMASPKQTPQGRGYDTSLNYFGHGNWGWSELEWGGSSAYNPHVPPPADPTGIKDLWDTDKPGSQYNGTVYEELIFRERMLNILESHDPSTPLFLSYMPKIAHYPVQAPPEYQEKFSFIDEPHRMVYHAMVNFLDDQLLNITNTFKAKGMWNNTLMVLTTDNGGYMQGVEDCANGTTHGTQCFAGEAGANNFPLRGGKYSDFEGGIRGNAFVSGGFLPAEKQGTKLEEIIHVSDWYATLCGLAGVDPTDTEAAKYGLPPIDSLDVWPLLSGQATKSPRESILVTKDVLVHGDWKVVTGQAGRSGWSGPQYPNVTSRGHEVGLQSISCQTGCLFNVSGDPSEYSDLASSNPGVLESLLALKAEMSKTIWPGATESLCVTKKECAEMDLLQANDACTDKAMSQYGGFYGPFLDS